MTLRAAESFSVCISGIKGWCYVRQSVSQVTAPPGCCHTLFITFPFRNSLLVFQPPSTFDKVFLLISLGAILIEFLILSVPVCGRERGFWCELQLLPADCTACLCWGHPRRGSTSCP